MVRKFNSPNIGLGTKLMFNFNKEKCETDFQYNKNIQLVVMNRVLLLTERLAQREPPFFFFLLLKENEEEKVTAKTKVSKSN